VKTINYPRGGFIGDDGHRNVMAESSEQGIAELLRLTLDVDA